jgi:retron-type reverse transcriptase
MKTIQFNDLTTLSSIAKNFGIQIQYLEDLVNSEDNSSSYTQMKIPKVSNPYLYRTVYQPEYFISGLHKNILTEIKYFLTTVTLDDYIHSSAHGFITKRSIATNASIHLGKQYLLQIDIKNFFESIPIQKIIEVFKKIGCTEEIAIFLTKICSVNGILKEGLNTSPMLANLYFYDIDIQLYDIAQRHNCTYTRYADDMTFSSNNNIREMTILKEVIETLHTQSLSLADEKTRYSSYGQAQYVTGLSISNNLYPRIPRKVKKLLRLELHYIHKHGFDEHFHRRGESFDLGHARLKGWIDYILSVEPILGQKMKKLYDHSKR